MYGLYTNFTSCSPRFSILTFSPPTRSFPLTLELSGSMVATRSISVSSMSSSSAEELADTKSATSPAELPAQGLRRSERLGSDDVVISAVVNTAIGGTEPANTPRYKRNN
uniref:Diacylglycerol O-acyltransferase 1 isoform X2 n=1 Tax=Rhizophora mucronata TaxID=61149 RepID=A0A2P2M8M4_RHIMU